MLLFARDGVVHLQSLFYFRDFEAITIVALKSFFLLSISLDNESRLELYRNCADSHACHALVYRGNCKRKSCTCRLPDCSDLLVLSD